LGQVGRVVPVQMPLLATLSCVLKLHASPSPREAYSRSVARKHQELCTVLPDALFLIFNLWITINHQAYL